MNVSQSLQPNKPSPAGTLHRFRTIAVLLVLGCGISLILYVHGSSWWYAPLAALAIVPAHLVVLGGIVFVVTRFVGGRFHGRTGHAHMDGSMMLHKPRQYDWLVRVITLGRESKLRQWMLDLADLQPGDAVLDVGCGTGTLLLAAEERVGPAGALHGVEPSAEMGERARRKAEERGIDLELVEASADSLPHPPGSFDAVFCTLVLHHMLQAVQEGAINEMRRVLRPGGRVVLVDWQRPKSVVGAITSGLLLVHLLHNIGPASAPLEAPGLEPRLRDLGFEDLSRRSFGGSVIGALVGRVGLGAHAEPLEA